MGNALENIITIGDPASPMLTLYNAPEAANGDGVVEVGGIFAVDTIGDELSIDTVSALVQYGQTPDIGMTVYEVYLGPDNAVYVGPDDAIYSRLLASTPDGTRETTVDLRALPYGTPIKWQCDGRTIAAFYLRNVLRVQRYLYRLNITSGVGLLDRVDHAGGVYTGQTFEAVATDVIGGLFPVTIAAALAPQAVYGWLPYDSRRNNLHQLLFAFGASLRRDADGNATIVFLTSSAPIEVPDSRVSFGGDIDYETPATRAEITEHAFFAQISDEEVTLFDNTDGGNIAASTPVIFSDAPIHDLTATGSLTIEESGVNYAVVSGVGTLTGKLYTHTTRIVAEDVENPTGEPNIKHVDDMTLVSLANSLNVARRVLSYCSSAKTVSASVILDGERCGDVLSVTDPFFEPMTAFLEQVTVNASTDLWGPCRLIEGYTPEYYGNNITGNVTLTGSGTWISPVTGTLTIIASSGGQGGGGGYDGTAAASPSPQSFSRNTTLPDGSTITAERALWLRSRDVTAGIGGDPGAQGAGGRVLVLQIPIEAGDEVVYNCGVGGEGGEGGTEPTAGALGTDTTITVNGTTYTTADGVSSDNGYIDPISGEQFAQLGKTGFAGGDGVGFRTIDGEVQLYTPAPLVFDGVEYAAGTQGADSGRVEYEGNYKRYGSFSAQARGGFGGGAAFKAAGNNGGTGSAAVTSSSARCFPGVGGDGADAQPPEDETTIGRGGQAGHGGGGGGAFGTALESAGGTVNPNVSFAAQTNYTNQGTLSINTSNPAQGGKGSVGGKGGNGGVRIYWGD